MKNTPQIKSCCKEEKKKNKDCCKTQKIANNQKKDDECGGNCSHPSCKCWTLLAQSVLPATLAIQYDFQFLFKEISISYLQVLDTNAGFYSNWEPPKIS
jgi:hypothetical protein